MFLEIFLKNVRERRGIYAEKSCVLEIVLVN